MLPSCFLAGASVHARIQAKRAKHKKLLLNLLSIRENIQQKTLSHQPKTLNTFYSSRQWREELEGAFAFGMPMPGRSYTSESYRFGFNGMEKDGEEWTGNAGNQLDFGARIYDSRLGRWFARDKLAVKYSGLSSYNFVGNNPILFIDPDGLQIVVPKVDDRKPVLDAINNAFGEGYFEFDKQGRLNYTGKNTGNLDPIQKKLFAYFSYINNHDIDTYIRLNEMSSLPIFDPETKKWLPPSSLANLNTGGTTTGATYNIRNDYGRTLQESIYLLYMVSKIDIYITPKGMQGIHIDTETGDGFTPYDVTLWHEIGHAFSDLFVEDNGIEFNERYYKNFAKGDWTKWTVGFENMYRDIIKLPRSTGKGQHKNTPNGEGADNGYENEPVPDLPERTKPRCQQN